MSALLDRLARARVDKRELEWVTRRTQEARTDRERVAAQLAIAEQARTYEQADVDRLTTGLRGLLRGVLASQVELSKEQEELAAAQLLCDELGEELRAIDTDLDQLAGRARAVADADRRYNQILVELEAYVRARGDHTSDLDALATTTAELARNRVELQEAISVAVDVQQSFRHVVNLVGKVHPRRHGEPERETAEALFGAITGRTQELYNDLTRTLAHASYGLRRFEEACASFERPATGSLDLQHAPLPSASGFVFRDILWTNHAATDSILSEVSRVSSALAGYAGELRKRDATLGNAIAECERMRAKLLDPAS